jgi:hypothetical protein
MRKVAIEEAQRCLNMAIEAVETMKNATKSAEFHNGWSSFLIAAHRIFSKLEQGAKVDGQSKAWLGRQIHERRTDPLLSYIHHARNADEHGLEPSAKLQGYKLGPAVTDPIVTIKGQTLVPTGWVSMHAIEINPAATTLYPVLDRGNKYDPPIERAKQKIQDPSALGIAELAIPFLRDMVVNARKLT